MAEQSLANFSDHLAALVAGAAGAVVGVQARDGRPSSGLIWRPGLVVTAAETVEREEDITVRLPDGSDVSAALAGCDLATDVALLRLSTAATFAPMASAAAPRLGALVVALGRAAEGPRAALGIAALVGPAWRSRRGGHIASRIELDIRLPQLAEGGPVLDAQGCLLGMAVFGPQRSVLLIPAATLDAAAGQLERHGRARRGWLGLAMQPVSLPAGATGLIVVGVAAAGPGAKAGILLGDILLAWDGAPVTGMPEVMARLDADSVGRSVALSLLRAGVPALAQVMVTERPAA